MELAGLEENQEYYLRSALVETTMNSGNYGNPFADASGKTVQPMGWRKKGEKKGKKKMASIATRHSSIIKAQTTMPKISSKMPKTFPILPKIKFLAFSILIPESLYFWSFQPFQSSGICQKSCQKYSHPAKNKIFGIYSPVFGTF